MEVFSGQMPKQKKCAWGMDARRQGLKSKQYAILGQLPSSKAHGESHSESGKGWEMKDSDGGGAYPAIGAREALAEQARAWLAGKQPGSMAGFWDVVRAATKANKRIFCRKLAGRDVVIIFGAEEIEIIEG